MNYYIMLHHRAYTTNPMRKSNACCSPFNKLHFFHFLIMGVTLYFITNQCKLAFSFIPIPLVVVVASLLVVQFSVCRSNTVYVIDYSCLRPPDNCRVPASLFLEHVSLMNIFNEGSIAYMNKVLSASGQSDQTYLPPPLHYIPPRRNHGDAIQEAHMLLFPVMDDLFSRTKISPHDIDVVIVTSSAFCTSPSMTSMIVNKYNLREDVKTYNVSGMGCSSGAIGIDMARNLLQKPDLSFVVVVSTEVLSCGWYSGNDKRKLNLNCRFRMGASAVLLTNKKAAYRIAKYKLLHVVRTQIASNDKAYSSGFLEEDSQGIRGFSLEPDVLQHFYELLRANFTVLGISILPMSVKVRHLASMVVKTIYNLRCELYVPRFGKIVDHYCIHPSSLWIVKEIGRRLKLREEQIEPAQATIHRFGNQSSAGMWYQMAYMEAKDRIKKGDKVWQIWVGSGLKCCSIVLQSLENLEKEACKEPWHDCINQYPIKP